jgi:hypothetical protein
LREEQYPCLVSLAWDRVLLRVEKNDSVFVGAHLVLEICSRDFLNQEGH